MRIDFPACFDIFTFFASVGYTFAILPILLFWRNYRIYRFYHSYQFSAVRVFAFAHSAPYRFYRFNHFAILPILPYKRACRFIIFTIRANFRQCPF